MSVIELLPGDVNYYKANLHCHTTVSDGELTPEEIKKLYQSRGYSIVAYTDHHRYRNHAQLNDENFLAIAGVEMDVDDFEDSRLGTGKAKQYHFNLFDTDPDYRKEEKKNLANAERRYHDIDYINGYLHEMKELGFLTCYNHPYWSMQTYEDYGNLRGLWAMEIYNYGSDGDGMYGYSPQVYDEMLRSGQRLYAVATDDNHNRRKPEDLLWDSFGGAVMIGARELTYPAVMEALQKGHFYSSISLDGRKDGPRIEALYLDGDRLVVRSSPVERIYVKTSGRRCYQSGAVPGGTITEAQFRLRGKEGYIRISLRDCEGRYAESNAYFPDEIWMRW